MAQEDSLIG